MNKNLDINTFVNELLGKCGLSLSDFIYINQGREREREIQRQMDIRDGYDPNQRELKNEIK